MTEKTLTHQDIRNLLERFSAAIMLDQRRVDANPAADFRPMYDDEMWRDWRAGHVNYIDRLLSTLDEIPSTMMAELTRVAIAYDPKLVGRIALDLFADAVSGSCSEELATAERFFYWLIRVAGQQPKRRARRAGARRSVSKWLAAVDPLRIAKDPECQYTLQKVADS
jgi:hypothetical protein